MYIRSNIS